MLFKKPPLSPPKEGGTNTSPDPSQGGGVSSLGRIGNTPRGKW